VTVEESRTEIDPVCGMTVDIDEAQAEDRTVQHNGRTYVFCSQGCLREFQESPEHYERQAE
jgi:P-type Cu+ transporter